MPSSHHRHVRPRRFGFTLFELLVSMAIIGLLSVIFFGALAGQKRRDVLKTAVSQLQSDIQRMQSNAQAGLLFGLSTPAGYGWWFDRTADPNGYLLFADLDQDGGGPGLPNGRYDNAPTDERIQPQTLAADVTVAKVLYSNVDYPKAAVSYAVPNGTTSIQVFDAGSSTWLPATGPLTVILKHSRLNLCYSVRINAVSGVVNKRTLVTCP